MWDAMKMMKMMTVAMIALVAVPAVAQRSHAVRGYTRRDGTYVAPHRATNPNSTKLDNWSTRGNVNPYTGREGTVDPYAPTQPKPPVQPTQGQR